MSEQERHTSPRKAEYWDLRSKIPGTPYYRLPPDWHFLSSTLVTVAYLALAGAVGGVPAFGRMLGFVILPLLCIWFPEALGSITTRLPTLAQLPISRPSPAGFLRFVAWLALTGPLIGLILGAFVG